MTQNVKQFTPPLKRKVDTKKDETPIMAFDIETRGLGGDFIIGAFMSSDGIRELVYSMSDAFEFIINHPNYRYLSHNASGYEFAYLYPYLYEYFLSEENVEIEPTLQGENRIVQFRIIKKTSKGRTTWKLDLRDTLCLFNTNLDNVAKSYCPEFPKGEPPWNDNHDNFDPTDQLWLNYLWRDCEILVVAYQRFRDIIWDNFRCNIGVTAGRTAMNAFQTTIEKGKDYWRIGEEKEKFIREAYYGGAVFPGHDTANRGNTWGVDINAAYGYQMGNRAFPTSTPLYTTVWDDGVPGIYRVVVHVPKSVYATYGFNPIPCRTKTGIIWRTGTFETTVTSMEILFAERLGCSFGIIEGYVWGKSEFVFREFITKCEKLEIENGGVYKPAIKLLRNSLYGKFGTKSDHKIIFYHQGGFPDKACVELLNEETGEHIEGVYVGTEPTNSPYMLPHWAVFITAYQRLYLFQFVMEAYQRGAKNVYCDTDSLKSDSHIIAGMVADGFITIGNRYGQFKIEERADEFIVIAPKTFYANGKEMEHEVKKAKGLPTRAISRNTFIDATRNARNDVLFGSVNNVLHMVKHSGASIGVKRHRKISDLANSQAWEVRDNKIYPRGYGEILE